MSCQRDAEHCNQIAGAHGAPEAVAVWAAGREGGGHCERCGGFLDSGGVCHNPRCWEFRGASAADLEKAGVVLHRPAATFDQLSWIQFADEYGLVQRLFDDQDAGKLLPDNHLPSNTIKYMVDTPQVFVFKPEDEARIKAAIAARRARVTHVSANDFLTRYATTGDDEMLVAQESATGFAVATGGRKATINREHLLWVMNKKPWFLTDREQRDLKESIRYLFAEDTFPERQTNREYWYLDDTFKKLTYDLSGRHCSRCDQVIVKDEKCNCAGPDFEALREHYRKTAGKRAGVMLDKSGPNIESLVRDNTEAWYSPHKKQWVIGNPEDRQGRKEGNAFGYARRQRLTKTEADYMRYLCGNINAARRNIRQVKVVAPGWYPKGPGNITPDGIVYLSPAQDDQINAWHAGRNIRLPKQAALGERPLTKAEKLDVAYLCFGDLEDLDSFDAGPVRRQIQEGLTHAT